MTQAGGQRHTLFHTVMMEHRSQRTRMARYKDISRHFRTLHLFFNYLSFIIEPLQQQQN